MSVARILGALSSFARATQRIATSLAIVASQAHLTLEVRRALYKAQDTKTANDEIEEAIRRSGIPRGTGGDA